MEKPISPLEPTESTNLKILPMTTLDSKQPRNPLPSAFSQLIAADKGPISNVFVHALCMTVQHDLSYQHDWTDLQMHTTPTSPSTSPPRPLLSGLSPTRLYVHPDEQIELLAAEMKQASTASSTSSTTAETKHKDEKVPVERTWVLPTHLREKWSLRRLAEAFEEVGEGFFPEEGDDDEEEEKEDGGGGSAKGKEVEGGAGGEEGGEETEEKGGKLDSGRGAKRLLLAVVSDDGTVVYYIVHDGVVKPRQN